MNWERKDDSYKLTHKVTECQFGIFFLEFCPVCGRVKEESGHVTLGLIWVFLLLSFLSFPRSLRFNWLCYNLFNVFLFADILVRDFLVGDNGFFFATAHVRVTRVRWASESLSLWLKSLNCHRLNQNMLSFDSLFLIDHNDQSNKRGKNRTSGI